MIRARPGVFTGSAFLPQPGEKIVGKIGVVFDSKQAPQTHHVYHAFHHVLTTKKPRSCTLISQNTPQKRPKTAKDRGRIPPQFFLPK
jgi:hypothetical protein